MHMLLPPGCLCWSRMRAGPRPTPAAPSGACPAAAGQLLPAKHSCTDWRTQNSIPKQPNVEGRYLAARAPPAPPPHPTHTKPTNHTHTNNNPRPRTLPGNGPGSGCQRGGRGGAHAAAAGSGAG